MVLQLQRAARQAIDACGNGDRRCPTALGLPGERDRLAQRAVGGALPVELVCGLVDREDAERLSGGSSRGRKRDQRRNGRRGTQLG